MVFCIAPILESAISARRDTTNDSLPQAVTIKHHIHGAVQRMQEQVEKSSVRRRERTIDNKNVQIGEREESRQRRLALSFELPEVPDETTEPDFNASIAARGERSIFSSLATNS